MKRREFVALLGSLLAPAMALAQVRTVRIGVLTPVKAPAALPSILKRLGELGFVEGKNLTVELRSADGAPERFPSLAHDLVEAKCNLIIAYGAESAARALVQATKSVPILIVAIDYDPLQAGLVRSLRRPGGNVTGIFIPNPLLAAKRLELLREVLPGARRILALADSYTTPQLEVTRSAAARLNMEIVTVTFTAPPYDLESAFEKGRLAGVEALLLFTSPVFFEQRARIAELAAVKRLPSVVSSSSWLGAGNMISHGVISSIAFVRAGDIAASILKGANPVEIAIEQAAAFETVINLKVAKALGLRIPQPVLLRADRVIE